MNLDPPEEIAFNERLASYEAGYKLLKDQAIQSMLIASELLNDKDSSTEDVVQCGAFWLLDALRDYQKEFELKGPFMPHHGAPAPLRIKKFDLRETFVRRLIHYLEESAKGKTGRKMDLRLGAILIHLSPSFLKKDAITLSEELVTICFQRVSSHIQQKLTSSSS
mmetsp:Transcript_14639/g.40690  ORF Transcript_14639/g.40690 Transcript_14639/m.40690 type:complete len:165 (+) Transcript_14639:495-989(+)|eukprot:CAMPEP_0172360950 /NCGR_PEP_ID=MMETSP1060-20121228/4879_1 /TAXON_ID=37318 /ORGANISM="Pseudo-nitzschia pungens, Strain cf. cingulata" /LENGTH=164 /DNA_ID=CAMNT_0013083073 /DNA_START=394 /DNA_END=888 /DNA_ORIENTATION=-